MREQPSPLAYLFLIIVSVALVTACFGLIVRAWI